RGRAELPRPGRAASRSLLGEHAARGTRLHAARCLDGAHAWSRDLHHGPRIQPAGRRAARLLRSAAESMSERATAAGVVVSIRDLTIAFAKRPRPVVEGVDLDVRRGEIMGL